MDPARNRWIIPATGLAIIFGAFLLRLYHLDAMGLEFDEAFCVQTAYAGFSGILRLVTTSEPHPPLYFSLLRLWYPLVGNSEFALRYSSLVASVLIIPSGLP